MIINPSNKKNGEGQKNDPKNNGWCDYYKNKGKLEKLDGSRLMKRTFYISNGHRSKKIINSYKHMNIRVYFIPILISQ